MSEESGPKFEQVRKVDDVESNDNNDGLTKSQRKKALAGLGAVAAAGTLAVAVSLPSTQESPASFKEGFYEKDVIVLKDGTAIIKKGANIRTSEKISKSDPNTVSWDTVITKNGTLAEVSEIVIKNPVITFGDNPDKEIPDEQYKPGEWINFPDTQGRWLKVSLSNKTSGLVNTQDGNRISGHPNNDGGFLANDNSTKLNPEEIAVVELAKADQ